MSPVAHDLRTTARRLLGSERKTCGLGKQLQPSSGRLRRRSFHEVYFCVFLFAWHFDAQSVKLSLSPRGFASKYEETKRAGRLFVVDSTRALPPTSYRRRRRRASGLPLAGRIKKSTDLDCTQSCEEKLHFDSPSARTRSRAKL